MQILVNGEELSFTLQKKESLEKILERVAEWAQKGDLYILDYRIKGKNQQDEMLSHDSETIEVLDVLLGNRSQLVLSQLKELDAYINRMGTFLASKMSSEADLQAHEKKDLNDGLVYIQESLGALEAHLPKAGEELEGAILSLRSTKDPMQRISALAMIKNKTSLWLKQAEFALQSEEERAQARKEFFSYLNEVHPILESVAMDITMGKESNALEVLGDFLDRLSSGLAILNTENRENLERKEKLNNFLRILSDLAAALDRSDMVTAADIVDFDIKEGIDTLKTFE